jgi:PLP dependent protein
MTSEIATQLNKLKTELPGRVRLIAVSKTKPIELLIEAYQSGQKDFGENYVQEICDKQPLMPADTTWHFIGHLQTNKVKYIAPFVNWVHAVDSERLLEELEKHGKKNQRIINCLIQVHIADEESKFGIAPQELHTFLGRVSKLKLQFANIRGLMGMASFTENEEKIRSEFQLLRKLFEESKKELYPDSGVFTEVSMGMSGDWKIAVEEGSTMVRIGSSIFGVRSKPESF